MPLGKFKKFLSLVSIIFVVLANLLIIIPNTVSKAASPYDSTVYNISLYPGQNRISIPYNMEKRDGPAIFDQFLIDNPTAEIFRPDPSDGTILQQYDPINVNDFGDISPTEVLYINVSSATTLQINAYNVGIRSGYVDLKSGWNLFGSPLTADFEWDKVSVQYGANFYNKIDEAASNGLIERTITGFNNETRQVYKIGTSQTSIQDTDYLKPTNSFWVYAYEDMTLVFNVTPPIQTFSIPLYTGHNRISIPYYLQDRSAQAVFGEFLNDNSGAVIKRPNRRDDTNYILYNPSNPNAFGSVEETDVFYINVPSDTELKPQGYKSGDRIGYVDIKPGWNLLGSPIAYSMKWNDVRVKDSAGSIFNSIDSAVDRIAPGFSSGYLEPGIWGFNNQKHENFGVGTDKYPGGSQDNLIQPEVVYWVYSNTDLTLIFDSTGPAPVPDTLAPVITLNGSASLNLTIGSVYMELGATALDNIDGTVSVITTGTVDTSNVGLYTVTYSATDDSSNTASINRNVRIAADTTELEITINSAAALYGSSTEGSGVGQYPSPLMANLQAAIDAANSVKNNINSTQEEVDAANDALRTAIAAFEIGRITSLIIIPVIPSAPEEVVLGESTTNITDDTTRQLVTTSSVVTEEQPVVTTTPTEDQVVDDTDKSVLGTETQTGAAGGETNGWWSWWYLLVIAVILGAGYWIFGRKKA